MNQRDQLYQLGLKAWEFRKEMGFTKALPEEIRNEAVELSRSGVAGATIAKALGVTKTSVFDWKKKYPKEEVADFSEVAVVEARPTIEIKLASSVQGCRVEIVGSDYSLLQRLMRKIGG